MAPVTFSLGAFRSSDLRLATVRGQGLRAPVLCSGPCSLNGSVKVSADTARRIGLKKGAGSGRVTIASGSRRLGAAGSATVRLKLTTRAKSALRSARRVPVTLKLRQDGGATITRKLTLSR